MAYLPYPARKRKETPIMATKAPMTARGVIFSLKKRVAGGMMRMGTMDMMVAAIPALVSFTERREREIPRNVPKKAPKAVHPRAARWFKSALTLGHQRKAANKARKIPNAAMIRIWVAAKRS